jgi:hypothetical protein
MDKPSIRCWVCFLLLLSLHGPAPPLPVANPSSSFLNTTLLTPPLINASLSPWSCPSDDMSTRYSASYINYFLCTSYPHHQPWGVGATRRRIGDTIRVNTHSERRTASAHDPPIPKDRRIYVFGVEQRNYRLLRFLSASATCQRPLGFLGFSLLM